MSKEKIGKIEKPSVDEFKSGRKLYFIPLIYCGKEPEADYLERYNKYWSQIESQLSDLELKLGEVNKIYHELIPVCGGEGATAIRDLSNKSYEILEKRLERGAKLEAAEESELLTEYIDWSRCLAIGLQNLKVLTRVYESYTEASKKRNEHISKQIDETLEANEIGVLLMREEHQLQFPSDLQVFYIAPPALDEIKRWLRDREASLNPEQK